MSVFGLGRAITLYGDLERVAIRPVHLRPEARRDRPTIGKICSRPDGKLHRFGRGPCIVSKCYFSGYERRVRGAHTLLIQLEITPTHFIKLPMSLSIHPS